MIATVYFDDLRHNQQKYKRLSLETIINNNNNTTNKIHTYTHKRTKIENLALFSLSKYSNAICKTEYASPHLPRPNPTPTPRTGF